MAVVSFPARNKLAYPAGRLSGFDPNHVAARKCSFSGVATYGGTFCNVLSQAKGTEGGTKTSSIYGPLGPVTNYVNDGATTTDGTVFPFVSSTAQLTLAAIFKVTAIPPSAAGYILNDAAAGANGIGDIGSTGNFFVVGNAFNTNTGVTYVLGAPYFFVASFSGAVLNWLVARLDTGQVMSGSVAEMINTLSDGTITVGNRGTAVRQINGGIAAAMASTASMSPQQLRQWADDPWAFWYPPQARSLVAATAVTPPTTVLYSLMNVG